MTWITDLLIFAAGLAAGGYLTHHELASWRRIAKHYKEYAQHYRDCEHEYGNPCSCGLEES